MPGEHARLSPSDAPRWMTCPGAIELCETFHVRDDSSEFSAEGTFAHTVRETCLELGLDPYNLLGWRGTVDGFDFELDEDMCEALMPGIDRIRQFKGPMTVEKRLYLDEWMPGQFGTLDLGISTDTQHVISDLKFGRGVAVEAYLNWQQIIYALGYWWHIGRHISKAKLFRIIIDQPRNAAGGGEWLVSLDELLAYGEEVKAAAARVVPGAPRVASAKGCYWCPASKVTGMCPEYEDYVLSIVQQKFPDLEEMDALGLPPALPDTKRLTPEIKAFIHQNASVFTKFLERIQQELLDDALSGIPIPGLKAVAGRAAPRKFRDKDKAEFVVTELIGTKGFKPVLKTPTQLEKEFGELVYNDIAPEIIRGESKPQLVSIHDAREPLKPTVEKFPILD